VGEAFHRAPDEQDAMKLEGEELTLGLDSGSQKVLRTSRSGEVVHWKGTDLGSARVLRWWR
jgi:hypothetical protein